MKKEAINTYIFLTALLLFCVALSFINNKPDYDIWARLIVGNHILESLSIAKFDFYSYTPTHIWYDHEWGASLIFTTVFKLFGQVGLTVLKGLMIFGISFFTYKIIKIRKPEYISAQNIMFYLLSILIAYDVYAATIRCHMFTFLFFAIWLYLLEKVRNGQKKWIFYLPFIMIFWSNIHGGCVCGLGLLAIYGIGEFLNKKPCKDYFVALILSTFALFINPYGYKYVSFLLTAVTMKRPFITEWLSPFHWANSASYFLFKFYIIYMFIAIAVYFKKTGFDYKKIDKTKFILFFSTLIIAVEHVKMIPFFVIVTSSLFYDEIFFFLKFKNFEKIKKVMTTILIPIAVIGFSVFRIISVDKNVQFFGFKYPAYPVEFIRVNGLKGNLFINFEYASFAAYKLYPQNKIFMDGRYEEVYDPNLIKTMKNFHLVRKNWDSVIKDYPTDIIIIEKNYKIYKKLKELKDWQEIFDDGSFSIFIKKSKAKNKYILPTNNPNYYINTLFDTKIKFEQKENFLTKPLD
ncbi:MAG: hypothetical protein PHV37_08070 [Candidatus Gastranaerophilales bacterium]|nr:hypothetical protein [Candidatus Gastranaerophilales bacterium]